MKRSSYINLVSRKLYVWYNETSRDKNIVGTSSNVRINSERMNLWITNFFFSIAIHISEDDVVGSRKIMMKLFPIRTLIVYAVLSNLMKAFHTKLTPVAYTETQLFYSR